MHKLKRNTTSWQREKYLWYLILIPINPDTLNLAVKSACTLLP